MTYTRKRHKMAKNCHNANTQRSTAGGKGTGAQEQNVNPALRRGSGPERLFQVYTMYVNRQEVLERAVTSLGKYQDHVVIIDNSPAQDLVLDGFPGEIRKPCVPLYCNQSYNLIQKLAATRGQQLYFIMHSDAMASEHVIEALLERAGELDAEGRRWGVLFTEYDVLCLMNGRVLRDVQWDRFLPLYYTDVDFYYRLKLAGIEAVETYLPVIHQDNGSTTHSDVEVKAYVETCYPAWREYYTRKWGGDRGQERFVHPFNVECS
jgi:hypothetical protein